MPTGILSPMHLLVVLVVALIVLGPKRLPGAGRALGQGLREFKDSISGDSAEPAQVPATTGLFESPELSTMKAPDSETATVARESKPMATAEVA